MSNNATRRPSSVTSSCSFGMPLPMWMPLTALIKSTLMRYSASSGKKCSTRTPPRVPNGKPAMCSRLHQEIRHVVRLLLGRHADVADREPRDARRRVRITLDEHRRDAERARDVVEAEAGIVAGQELLRVDVEREQIVNRVLVLRAIQPMQGRPARIRVARRELVERAFEIGDERLALAPRRDAARSPAASCRSAACARPFPTPRDAPRRRRRRVDRGRTPRTAPSRSRLPRCDTCMQVVSRNARGADAGASSVARARPRATRPRRPARRTCDSTTRMRS